MKKIIKTLALLFILLFLFCIANIWISFNFLTISNFTVEAEDIISPFRIVLISDLHNHSFGRDNRRLVNKVSVQQPDLIILDGDMLNKDSSDSSVVTTLITQLKDIAPVYFSLGNHELAYIENDHEELVSEIESAGAIVLNYKTEDITINGNDLRLGGLYEYGFNTNLQTQERNDAAVPYIEEWVNTDRYLIMCAHRPDSFYVGRMVDYYGIDLQLSGHYHGGQVIVPFKGGLYAPLEGFFPKYDYGQYEIGDSSMIITRGLGSNLKILPRFNNPPEIAVIDVSQKS